MTSQVVAQAQTGWGQGDALRHLVHPLDPNAFLADFWQRRPLHVGGRPGHFRELFGIEALVAAVQRQHEVGLLIRVSTDHEGDGGGASAHVPVDATELADAFERGASVCVDPIDRADAVLAGYAEGLRRDIGHPGGVDVKCYLSPTGYGFNAHFDAHVVTAVQLEGRKRWRFSPEPGVPEPLDNAFLDADGEIRYSGRLPSDVRPWERPTVDPSSFEEVVLEPGDVLCLPAGTWHAAKALERSLSLNIAFAPLSAYQVFTAALARILHDDPEWRRCVPTDGGTGPAPAAGFFDGRRQALLAALAGLDADGPELQAAWESAVRDAHHGPAGPGATAAGVRSPAARLGAGAGADVTEPGPLGYRGGVRCTVRVSNLPDAIAWYVSRLGLRPGATISEFGWAELASATPGFRIGLFEGAPAGEGGTVVEFGVADVDAARAHLEGTGVAFDGPTREIAGVTKFASFTDPDGNRLMLHEAR